MLGRIPLVSMSDNRLGGMENSSLRYRSATRALEFSTSRIVSPSFSRRARRLFPAVSTRMPPQKCRNHIKGNALLRSYSTKKGCSKACYEIRTRVQASPDAAMRPVSGCDGIDSSATLPSRIQTLCSDFVTKRLRPLTILPDRISPLLRVLSGLSLRARRLSFSPEPREKSKALKDEA